MTIRVKLVMPTAYGRPALWEAEYPAWPSIDSVQFRADDDGTGNIERIAQQKLWESARDCSVD